MRIVESISQPGSQLAVLEEVRRDGSRPDLGAPVGVILAAGASSRLGGVSKPLARVAGVTLVERAVSTFRSAGVERIVVVVGHASADVREFVARRGLDVELVDNDG